MADSEAGTVYRISPFFNANATGVSPTSGLTTSESGDTATFSVFLDSPPTANVTINLSSSDTTEGTVSPSSLTFTPCNWSIPQNVTVTGVADSLNDGDVAYSIVTAPAISDDPNYSGQDAADVAVVNLNTASFNTPPTAGDLELATDRDVPLPITLAGSDSDDNPLDYTIVTPPAHGSLTGTGASRLYTPQSLYFGADSFTYRVNDGTADSNIATVSIAVGPADSDDDALADAIDTAPLSPSNEFSDGTTFGGIANRGNQVVRITDASDPTDGVIVTTDAEGGPDPAITVVGNGVATLSLGPGTQVIVTQPGAVLHVLADVVNATFTGDDGQEAMASLGGSTELAFQPATFTFTASPNNNQSVRLVTPLGSFAVAPGQTATPVLIDIKPGSATNVLNVGSNGMISVAILATAVFDPAQVNVTTVVFAGAHATAGSFQDVNGDGRADLVLQFRTQDTYLRSLYSQLLADDLNADGILDSTQKTVSLSLSAQTVDDVFLTGFDDLDLFLAGKSLRTLLDELAASGVI
jgi:hypothetical protein